MYVQLQTARGAAVYIGYCVHLLALPHLATFLGSLPLTSIQLQLDRGTLQHIRTSAWDRILP